MDDKLKVIDKVKKVLAKTTNNSTEEEAKTAFLLAQSILIKNGLSLKDIELKENVSIVEDCITISKEDYKWKSLLATVICDNFKCKIYVQAKDYNKTYNIIFMGYQEDVEIAQIVFESVVNSIIHFALYLYLQLYEDMKKQGINFKISDFKSTRKQYIFGFISGLNQQYKDQVAQNEWALVILPDKEIIDKFNSNSFSNVKTRLKKPNNEIDNFALSKGYHDGKNYKHKNGELN